MQELQLSRSQPADARQGFNFLALMCCRKGNLASVHSGVEVNRCPIQPICVAADSCYITRFFEPRSTLFFLQNPLILLVMLEPHVGTVDPHDPDACASDLGLRPIG